MGTASWRERLNALLFRNITATEDLNKMRPMKITLIDDLEAFIAQEREEAKREVVESLKRTARLKATVRLNREDPQVWEDSLSVKELLPLLDAALEGTNEEV